MGLTETVASSPYRFELWFRKRTMGEAFVLQAPSNDVKAAWVKEISKLLWRQAIKNRGMKITMYTLHSIIQPELNSFLDLK